MPVVLLREGYDLDELLAELDRDHPNGVHAVDIRYDREGGVGGFFARRKVGVSYTPVEPADAETPDNNGDEDEAKPDHTAPRNLEFARMLLDLAAEKAAARRDEESLTAPTEPDAGAKRTAEFPPTPVNWSSVNGAVNGTTIIN